MKRAAAIGAVMSMVLAIGSTVGADQTNYSISKIGGSELKLGLGPRPVAMGEAFAAEADDLNAPSWNPAGLSRIQGIQAGLMHNINLENTSLEYAAYAQNLFAGAGIGAQIAVFNYGVLDKVDEVNGLPEVVGQFTPMVLTGAVGYGQQVIPALAVGATVKILNQRIDTQNDTAVAADAGILFKPGWEGLQLGAAVQNLGTQLAGTELPVNLKAGAAYSVPLKIGASDQWIVLADANVPFGDSNYTSVSLGTEYWYNNLAAGRLGYKFKNQGELGGLNGLTAGAGFKLAIVNLDYALVSFGDLGLTHQIAVTVRFD